MTDTDRLPAPMPPAAEVRRRLAAELALPSRLGYTALLLAGTAMAALTTALTLTEPALPAATRWAFVVLALMGAAWAAFAVWVLARRRVLLAVHRVVAARMAVLFTAIFTGGALLVARRPGMGSMALTAAAVGAGMLLLAVAVLVRAHRRVRWLAGRRAELERELGS